MSVVLSKRRRSKLEVIYKAEQLNDILVDLMQRNFAINSRYAKFRYGFFNGNSISETEITKRRILLSEYKKQVNNIIERIIHDLRSANAIFPTKDEDFEERRKYQNQAISECDVLEGILQKVARIFDVDLRAYKNPIENIITIKQQIKRWRSSDNLRRRKLAE